MPIDPARTGRKSASSEPFRSQTLLHLDVEAYVKAIGDTVVHSSATLGGTNVGRGLGSARRSDVWSMTEDHWTRAWGCLAYPGVRRPAEPREDLEIRPSR